MTEPRGPAPAEIAELLKVGDPDFPEGSRQLWILSVLMAVFGIAAQGLLIAGLVSLAAEAARAGANMGELVGLPIGMLYLASLAFLTVPWGISLSQLFLATRRRRGYAVLLGIVTTTVAIGMVVLAFGS